ncbi:MAG: DUF4465 domain-containing protein [Bacteroidaceae bacterium]|nr:DUF4465 domain-containing protein [Bacteroidaceae bacterium]
MMKQRILHALLLTFTLSLQAWADREVNQQQFGKQTIEVASDEVITFYDPWGTANIVDQNSYNAQSLTVFKPAEAGKSVQITFEQIDLNQYNTGYYLYINLYDGTADADNTFTWATSSSEVTASSSLSGLSGTLLAEKINNDNKPTLPATYTSGTADGALSVGFMHRNSNPCAGWVAKVRVVTLENMTITGAGSNYDDVTSTPTSKQNIPLANAYVTATGVMNPDNVTGIYFTMPQNEGMFDPLALKLYRGDKLVEATVAADGEGYSFTFNAAPAPGVTTFTIKGDILPTASVGAKAQLTVTKVTTVLQAEGIQPFTGSTAVTVVNPALVLMTAEPQTVTVGETPLQFYDEGGIDGGITAKTNGQVTFVPATEGQKVMVNFTKNAIWHGSYYNQELRIYSGTEVNANSLIKTLQQGETGIVRSTAEDGSLTVVLFSDASTTTAADGFEAEVSLFTPQPMDFDGLAVAQYATGTVCAGDADQRILDITVKAKNTEPAMQLTKMAFTTNETNDIVTKAALFFGNKKVGETDIIADAFDITLTEALPLVEGDNNFYLAYTISDEALNNQAIDAKLISVTALVNGEEKTEVATEGNPEGNRTVENIVLSHADQGSVTKTVNGSIVFNTKARSEYTENYESGTDDRINVFVPKHEGMVCQIDFSEFAIYYNSYSSSSSAKFKIYNGQGTTGEVLWEPTERDDYTVGPNKVIRSSAADGALTVYFNPNQTYGSAAGFQATVSEYLSKDMQIAGVEVSQASTAIASVGAENQDLLNVNVKTDGNLNPVQLSSIKLNLKETETSLSKVSVWQNNEKLGEAVADAAVEIIFSEPVTLKEGNNLFVVKADVSSEAEAEDTIDAKVVAIVTTSDEIAVEDGDPEGSRTLKNMIILVAGDNGERQMALGKTIMLYDDGGAEGDGADGVEATITFAPAEAGHSIKLTDKGISFNYTSHLYIYEGGEVNDDKLIVDLSGSSAKFDPIISDTENSDGKLTIKYVGKGSYTRPNFAIEVEGYKKSEVAITGVETEDISVNEVLKGQTDVKMLKIAVTAKGELGSVSLTGFDVASTSSEVIAAQHIYQTGTLASFSANETFNGEYTITGTGTYYFWLTYDLNTDAEVGQTADAQLTAIVAGGETIAVTEPATASVTVATGKSGTYTIGADADYATIQGAIDDMGTLGMEGPVVLKIKAGEYNEKVRIPYIKGMGAVNTLTIESESGQRDVKIYHDNYTTSGYSDDQHKKDYGVVTLYEANYVTLRNLEICTTDKAYKAIVMVKDQSRHTTIDGCYLHAPACTASSGEDVCLVGHTIIDEENKNNDYLTVRNCLLEGGKMGVSMGGTSYVALPKEVGGIIEGNTFKNNAQKAIYVMDELGVKIKNNTIIIEPTAATRMSVGVLDLQLRDEYSEATEITGNIFNVAPSTYVAVMNLRQLQGTAEAPVLIANNVINLTSLNASYAAFKFNGGNIKNVNVANNTFRMTGENGGPVFWASSTLGDGYGNVNVVNNIIQNETNGYAVNLYNDGNLGTDKFNFQNNLMYTAGETFFRASSSTTGDFAAFVEKTAATGNINKQVAFASDDILEPAATLEGDLLAALPLSYVTTDINGTARPAESITIGAYEYDPDLTRIPVVAEGYPQAMATAFNEAMVTVKADMNGKAYVALLRAEEAAPGAAELKEQGTPFTVTKDAEASLKIDTLQEKTTYVAYILVESTRGNQTEVLATEAFTTPMEPIDLLIACTEPEQTVANGTEAELKVMVASGLAPFTVNWMNSKHQTVSTFETDLLGEEITASLIPTQSGDYYVTITDGQQKTATDTCRVIVTGPALTADFENLYLEENSYWRGPDTKGELEEGLYGDDQYQGSFVSGSYHFSNNYSIDWGSWSGFSYSNRTATSFASYSTDQWNSCVGEGHNGSENYAVFFEDSYAPMTVTVLNKPDGDLIRGFYITNAAVTVNSILNGDGMTGERDAHGQPVDGTVGFKEGDYFLLTITGDNDEEVEYYLADYRSENADEHYYVNDWQWVDLTSLGKVKELTFSLKSSRRNSWGYTTPLYFCMDDFNGIGEGPATMEDLALDEESYWDGSDLTGGFVSGAYRFENGYFENQYGSYSYGFSYSNKSSSSFTTYSSDRYNSCVGGGAEGSATFAVFNMSKGHSQGVEVMKGEEGDSVSGFYVTNAASTYKAILEGTDLARQFAVGDWLKLTVTGWDASGNETGTVDYYLADLRDSHHSYIVDEWRWVDLTSLGRVKRLSFTMSSSDSSQWSMNTPSYFCLDNLGGMKPEDEQPIVTSICTVQPSQSAVVPVAIYSLNGTLQHELLPGVNIVKYSDGSQRKVLVK